MFKHAPTCDHCAPLVDRKIPTNREAASDVWIHEVSAHDPAFAWSELLAFLHLGKAAPQKSKTSVVRLAHGQVAR